MRVLVLALACVCGCSRNEPSPPSQPEPVAPARVPPSRDLPKPVVEPPAPATDIAGQEPAAKPPARSFDDLQGLTTAELVAHWGEPDAKTRDRWTYKFPRTGCTDEQLVYVLHLRAGKVAKIERTSEQTGKICGPLE